MSTETGGSPPAAIMQEAPRREREYGPEIRDSIASLAQSFLSKPEAQKLDRSQFDWLFDPKKFKHEDPVEILINAKDSATNTSFLIEKAPSNLDEKGYSLSIKWLTMGKDKGSLPSGHISILYSQGKDPIVRTHMIPATWAIPENDGYWEQKGGKRSFYSYQGSNNVTDEDITKILERLDRAKVEGKQTENTAHEAVYDSKEAAFLVAAYHYHEVKRAADWKTMTAVIMAEIEFRKEEKKWEEFKKEWKKKRGSEKESTVEVKMNNSEKETEKTSS